MPRAAIGERLGEFSGARGHLGTGPAQDLPQGESGAGGRLKISAKCLVSLVGATGFEPVTWSTQNSRATRLRYAPSSRRPRYTLRSALASRGGFADMAAVSAERAFSDASVR